jgi:hypothetical protein
MEALAADIPFIDRTSEFRSLVGSAELRDYPIHRWYYYQERFSPRLPCLLLDCLGAGTSRTVADLFAGVAKTALALIGRSAVDRVIGIEYSPFTSFVGQAKLAAIAHSPDVLTKHL